MGRNVVVGVGGGIAAYKACHLIRNFTEAGDTVRVVPTENALRFVGAATFEALSGHPVSSSVYEGIDEVRHVRIGKEADLIVIAPATADLIARIASGRADDLLTATILVATCPVVIAPAMHTEMWLNPATQANVATLRERGLVVLDPASGRLTGKDSGPGRLGEPEVIADVARAVAKGAAMPRDLEGKTVLVTAGGTQENIDPVRFIGNRSSGRQGFAIAEMAAQRGAEVVVVAGHTDDLPVPTGARVVKVSSTRQMYDAVQDHAAKADLMVFAAAVADFRPESEAASKMKKGSSDDALSTVHLVENPDILAETVARRRRGELKGESVIVGFAAETGDEHSAALDYAKKKLVKKGCDLLMCNDVGGGKVFGESTNSGWILGSDGSVTDVTPGSKFEVASVLLDAARDLRLNC